MTTSVLKNLLERKVPIVVESNVGYVIDQVLHDLTHEEIVELVKHIDLMSCDWGVTYDLLKYFLSVYKKASDLDEEIKTEYEKLLKEHRV